MSDPIKAIARQIQRQCDGLADVLLEQGRSSAWYSLLFEGARHHIALRLEGGQVEEAITLLSNNVGEPDFSIPGHLLADIQVAAVNRGADHALVEIDALTIRH